MILWCIYNIYNGRYPLTDGTVTLLAGCLFYILGLAGLILFFINQKKSHSKNYIEFQENTIIEDIFSYSFSRGKCVLPYNFLVIKEKKRYQKTLFGSEIDFYQDFFPVRKYIYNKNKPKDFTMKNDFYNLFLSSKCFIFNVIMAFSVCIVWNIDVSFIFPSIFALFGIVFLIIFQLEFRKTVPKIYNIYGVTDVVYMIMYLFNKKQPVFGEYVIGEGILKIESTKSNKKNKLYIINRVDNTEYKKEISSILLESFKENDKIKIVYKKDNPNDFFIKNDWRLLLLGTIFLIISYYLLVFFAMNSSFGG